MLREGVLRERLRLAFAKATGSFDDFDILSIVGRSQIGRLPYTGEKEQLLEDVPFQSVDEILASVETATSFVTCSINSRLTQESAVCSPKSLCATRAHPLRLRQQNHGFRKAIGVTGRGASLLF